MASCANHPEMPDGMDYRTASFCDRLNAHIAEVAAKPVLKKLDLMHADQRLARDQKPPWTLESEDLVKLLQDNFAPVLKKLELVHNDQGMYWTITPPWVLDRETHVKLLQDTVVAPLLETQGRLSAQIDFIETMMHSVNLTLKTLKSELVDKRNPIDMSEVIKWCTGTASLVSNTSAVILNVAFSLVLVSHLCGVKFVK